MIRRTWQPRGVVRAHYVVGEPDFPYSLHTVRTPRGPFLRVPCLAPWLLVGVRKISITLVNRHYAKQSSRKLKEEGSHLRNLINDLAKLLDYKQPNYGWTQSARQ